MSTHEIHALSGAYAVDALDADERARFEEHLASCATCQDEVASLQEATALLGAVEETPLPAGLRDRVLADIKTVRPLPPAGGGPLPDLPDLPDLAERRRRRPRWSGLVGIAAAAALVVGGVVVWEQTRDDAGQEQVSNPIDAILRARDVKHVSVDLPGGASATVFSSLAHNRAVLVTDDMPPAPEGRVYQVWLQKGDRMVPAGLMSEGGHQEVLLDGKVAGASGAGITVEPAGGSEEPTSAPVALFDFAKAT